jgi:hypothetical protein
MRTVQQRILYDQTTGLLNIKPPAWHTGSDIIEEDPDEE